MSNSKHITGMAGVHYVCYKLSKQGFCVTVTSRNAKGVDAIVYSETTKQNYLLQVKSLSKNIPVTITDTHSLKIANYLVICYNLLKDEPQLRFISTDEVVKYLREINYASGKKIHIIAYSDYKNFDTTLHRFN